MRQATPNPDLVVRVQKSGVTVTDGNQGQVLQIPTSHDEMMALTARREQLNDQLQNVTDRRNDIIEQMRTVPNQAMPGLQAQLNVLEMRVMQLENDLALTGREIAGASPQLISMAQERSNDDPNGSFDDGVGAGIGGTFLVMSVLFFVLVRRWKKSPFNKTPRLQSADSERLQRLEQGMDAVAIEVERISEGQRFVTKLLSDQRSAEPTPR